MVFDIASFDFWCLKKRLAHRWCLLVLVHCPELRFIRLPRNYQPVNREWILPWGLGFWSKRLFFLWFFSLAVADLLLLLSAPPDVASYFVRSHHGGNVSCKMVGYSRSLSAFSTVLNLMAITVERCVRNGREPSSAQIYHSITNDYHRPQKKTDSTGPHPVTIRQTQLSQAISDWWNVRAEEKSRQRKGRVEWMKTQGWNIICN